MALVGGGGTEFLTGLIENPEKKGMRKSQITWTDISLNI
jgi:hypothetical protein